MDNIGDVVNAAVAKYRLTGRCDVVNVSGIDEYSGAKFCIKNDVFCRAHVSMFYVQNNMASSLIANEAGTALENLGFDVWYNSFKWDRFRCIKTWADYV